MKKSKSGIGPVFTSYNTSPSVLLHGFIHLTENVQLTLGTVLARLTNTINFIDISRSKSYSILAKRGESLFLVGMLGEEMSARQFPNKALALYTRSLSQNPAGQIPKKAILAPI
jgi:hypothetical protein